MGDLFTWKEILMFGFAVGAFVYETRSLKGTFNSKISDLQKNMDTLKKDLKEDIERLERAQEKSNNVRERLAVNENATKSAHHRIDGIEKKENR
jgi:hypothetical protein